MLIRGELESREFVAFWVDEDNRIQAAMNVNVWDVIDEIKTLIAEHTTIDPDRLVDPAVPYTLL